MRLRNHRRFTLTRFQRCKNQYVWVSGREGKRIAKQSVTSQRLRYQPSILGRLDVHFICSHTAMRVWCGGAGMLEFVQSFANDPLCEV